MQLYLIQLGFQVFNVVLSIGQALIISHVSLHHFIIRMLQ